MKSVLNIVVSCFANCKSTFPRNVNLLSWLTSDKYQNKVEEIRRTQDEGLQKALKNALPVITPSGIFSKRSEKGLIEHSGLLSFDIDFKDNKHITNFGDLKAQISNITSVAYCGLSVRGRGFWGLVPVPGSTPELHKQRFKALAKDFKELGIILDPSGSDVCRLRFYSWDPEAYFNHSAKPYIKILKPQHKPFNKPFNSDTRQRVEATIDQIKTYRIDITNNYKEEWIKLASALANEFGEAGRGYFHAVSQFHPNYSIQNTNRQFDQCLKHNYDKITIGSFFKIASDYGICCKKFSDEIKEIPTRNTPGKVRLVKDSHYEITELENFFRVIKIPEGPIKINSWSTITKPELFIKSHLEVAKAQNRNNRYNPYVERLRELKIILN